jgi:hypothetical protein
MPAIYRRSDASGLPLQKQNHLLRDSTSTSPWCRKEQARNPRGSVIMRTNNELRRFRDALSVSALLLLLPAVYPAPPADRFLLSSPPPQAVPLIEVEPRDRSRHVARNPFRRIRVWVSWPS